MTRKFFLVAIPCLAALGLVGMFIGTAQAKPIAAQKHINLTVEMNPDRPPSGLHLVSSDKSGLVFELTLPEFRVEKGFAEDGACQVLRVDGYGETDQSGWPRLPQKGTLIGIPSGVTPTLTILEGEPLVAPKRFDLCPVTLPNFEVDISGQVKYFGHKAYRDIKIYAQDRFSPREPVELVSTGYLRSQRVASLRLSPFQYNPVSGELQYYPRLQVRVDFPGSGKQSHQPVGNGEIDEGALEIVLQDNILNYQQARGWRTQPVSVIISQPNSSAQAKEAYKLFVDQDGVYQVTIAQLQAAGLPVESIDPRTLRLTNQGTEHAIYIAGESDGSLEPGDYLLFYGQKMNTRYSDINVYWLTWGGANGLRMPTLDNEPDASATVPTSFYTTQDLEVDYYYFFHAPSGIDDDVWYWDYVPISTTKDFTTSLNHIATSPVTTTLRGLLKGNIADPYHHTKIYMNSNEILDINYESKGELPFEVDVPQAYLQEGKNTITVESPGGDGVTVNTVLLNWFEIDYSDTYVAEGDLLYFDGDEAGAWQYEIDGFSSDTLVAFDITNPSTPVRVINSEIQPNGGNYRLTFRHTIPEEHHYVALSEANYLSPVDIVKDEPSNLRSIANGADYILITHGDFYTQTLPLADWRTVQGLRVSVVNVQDAYDEFNGGVFNPEAIRNFLAYAYANWQPPAPLYILLVGDGHYDPKGYRIQNEVDYIPPYLSQVDPWLGETAADNRYVAVSGDDILPDMYIGRLPANSPAETSAMVDKILAYEQNPPETGAGWNGQALFVADQTDRAGNFALFSDAIIGNHLPAPYSAQKIYYGTTHTQDEARLDILSTINDGRLIVNYIGHAWVRGWGSKNLFTVESIASLNNADRLPFMVPMTCLEGAFHWSNPYGEYSSLAENVVRAANKGGIASWSPTGFGVATGHDYLNSALYDAIFYDGVVQLGAATTQAKLQMYANTTSYPDLIDTYMLFGDPATPLAVLKADVGIRKSVLPNGELQPGDEVIYTLAYSNTGEGMATHVVISDTLPPGLVDVAVSSTGAAIAARPESSFIWDVADLLPGEGGTITIQGVVRQGYQGTLSNSASIETAMVEADKTNNRFGPVASMVRASELLIEKDGPYTAQGGEKITYTLVYENIGDLTAVDVVLEDLLAEALLDPQVTFSGAGITLRPGSMFIWDVNDLAPGDSGKITITGQIDPEYSGVLVNSATISTQTPEVSLSNNTDNAVTVVDVRDIAELVIEKDGPTSIEAGYWVMYALSYLNVGDLSAAGVVISDVLPVQLLNPVITSSGAAITPRPGSQYVWDVSDLAPGDSGAITITAQVDPGYTGVLTNTVSISTLSPEATLLNNIASQITLVVPPPPYRLFMPFVPNRTD